MERETRVSDKKWFSYNQSKIALLIISFFLGFHIYRFMLTISPLNPTGSNGGSTIALVEAKGLLNNFRPMRFRNGKAGAMISKKAIDAMLPVGTTNNCLIIYPAAEIINGDSTLRLLLEPYTCTDVNINTTVVSKIFKTESLCPNECGTIGN